MRITRRAALALPAIPSLARAAGSGTLRFIPHADLALLDPIWTQAFTTRNHAMMVYDTLYGSDAQQRPHPQMAEGHEVSDDKLTWRIRLREGLRFHDGAPVLAKDCVASIRRWGARDTLGQMLMAATDELSAMGDREIRFRLKRPFPLLTAALGKGNSNVCVMMAERHALTDPFRQVTEVVGSGPYRFLANERLAGARAAYARFDGYVPRADGPQEFTAGPKVAHFERIEWHTMPDAGTAAAAMRNGEMDWWEQPSFDLLPIMRRDRNLAVEVMDPYGTMGMMRVNHLQPPFDNPALRRAILGAIDQADYMQAVAGTDRQRWRAGIGMFPPGSDSASEAGLAPLTGPRDLAATRRAVAASGYAGQPAVLLIASDSPSLGAFGEIAADAFRKVGLNVDAQTMDWGTVLQRIAKTEPVAQGGWSAFFTTWSGLDLLDPARNGQLRATGRTGPRGWPTSPALEALRASWVDADTGAERRAIAERVQVQAMEDVPCVPLGQYFQPTVRRRELQGMLRGYPLFWNIRR